MFSEKMSRQTNSRTPLPQIVLASIYGLSVGELADLRSGPAPVVTFFACPVCNLITYGRRGRAGRHVGDYYLPRRHKFKGVPCPGNIEFAHYVNVRLATGEIESVSDVSSDDRFAGKIAVDSWRPHPAQVKKR